MKKTEDSVTAAKTLFNWFPGHMAKALREIKQKLKMVDIVLEIRDARAPLVSGNPALDENLGQKKKVIVFNKVNLADPLAIAEWSTWLDEQNAPYLFVNCFDKAALKKAISLARKIVEKNRRECNPEYVETKTKLRMMIVGLPNTGKSTIINQLANKSVAKVADRPGQTQIQQWISIENEIELLDTPGVMPPHITKAEHGLWLSAIHAIPDDISDEEDTALFLLKYFLKRDEPRFKERYKLVSSSLELEQVLHQIATVRGCLKQKGLIDLPRVYKIVLADFRQGELGLSCFGNPPPSKIK